MQNKHSNYQQFLKTHRVFHANELERYCSVSGTKTRNLLSKLQRERKVSRLRNSVYSVLPQEAGNSFSPPALLIAAKQAPDAILGYRSALAFYGMSRNAHSSHTFLSRHRIKPVQISNNHYQPCLPAKQLWGHDDFGVEEHTAWDTPVKVVSKERLLVDLLDRLDLSGGWEEIVNAFQYENGLDFQQIVDYLKLLKHPAASARVGFFLEQYQSTMNVPNSILEQLEALKPKNPEHFYRSRREGRLLKRWNLYVPQEMLNTETAEEYYEF